MVGRVSAGEEGLEEEDVETPELDLHGMPPSHAFARLERFLHTARVRGDRRVIVVTGAGRSNASGKPVLRTRVEDWLRGPEGKRYGVRGTARIAKGGALSVALDGAGRA